MKRIAIVSILFLAVVFTACKKNNSASVSLVGNWKLTTLETISIDSTTTPITKIQHDSTYDPATALVATFNTDNTFYSIDFSDTPPSIVQAGSYILSNGKITLIISGQPNQVASYTLSATTFAISQTTSTSGHSNSISETFTHQ